MWTWWWSTWTVSRSPTSLFLVLFFFFSTFTLRIISKIKLDLRHVCIHFPCVNRRPVLAVKWATGPKPTICWGKDKINERLRARTNTVQEKCLVYFPANPPYVQETETESACEWKRSANKRFNSAVCLCDGEAAKQLLTVCFCILSRIY